MNRSDAEERIRPERIKTIRLKLTGDLSSFGGVVN
jgi:hypothetical protein